MFTIAASDILVRRSFRLLEQLRHCFPGAQTTVWNLWRQFGY